MIEGVTLRDLTVREDERGWLVELLSENLGDEDLCHIYLAMCRPGVAKAFHAHLRQADRFVCVEGTAKIGMVDLRGPIFGRRVPDFGGWEYLAVNKAEVGFFSAWAWSEATDDPDLRFRLGYDAAANAGAERVDEWWAGMVGSCDTFLRQQTVILSSERPQVLTIPAGVAHGQMALDGNRSVILNAPTRPYCREAPDELRIPYDAFGFQWEVQSR